MSKKLIYLISLVLVLGLTGNAWGLVWGQKDIGNPGIAGSASYEPGTDTWTISGSGHDIWGNSDGFYYVYRPLSGDGSLQVNLVSMDVTGASAKVGPMIRETLEAGSKHAMTAMTRGQGIQFVWRVNTNQGSDGVTRSGEFPPKELRITRIGDLILGEYNFEYLPGLFMWFPVWSETIPMNTEVTIGMVVCSSDNGVLNTAVLDNVILTAAPYEKPWDLSPADGTTKVCLTPTLSWLPGDSATSHDVLTGTDPATLSLVATKPLGDESYTPAAPLAEGTMYYWQIVEQPLGQASAILSFKTGPTIAYDPSPPDGAENVPLDVVLSWLPGCGAAQHDVYFGTDPAALPLVTVMVLGDESYAPELLESCTTYYWQINEVSGTDVLVGDVWSFTTGPTIAYNPSPPDGAEDVPLDVVLSWSPGCCADSHDVYFGTEPAAMVLVATKPLGDESYDPGGLELCTTHYWRIDEVCEETIIVAAVPPPEQVIIGGDYTIPGYTIAAVAPDAGCLLAEWAFEGNYDDSSGSGFNGTPIGDATIVPDAERGDVLSLDGDGDYVDCGNPAALNFSTGNWSLSVWTKNTMTGTGDANKGALIANGGDGGGGHRYCLILSEQDEGEVTLVTDDDADEKQARGDTTKVNDDVWHHVLGVRDGDTIRAYIDGVEEGSATLPGGYDLSGTSQANVLIGAISRASDLSIYKDYAGLIDDAQIYNCALTEGNARYLAGVGDLVVDPIYVPTIYGPLVAHYEFDGDASDSSGNNLHGTENGDPIYVAGVSGQAISLDGDGDYVDCGNDPLFNPAGGFSISVWVNMSSWGGNWGNVIVSKYGERGVGWQLRRHGGDPVLTFTTRGIGNDDARGHIEPTLGEWHHIAAIYDGSKKVVYIDCQKDVEVAASGTINASDHNVYIGARANADTGPEAFFNGMIDDVRIYNYALSYGQALYLGGCGDLVETEIWKGDVWSFTTICKVAVDIDIKPRSCPNPLNIKSKGVLPVAILGSEDLDVTTIDVTSVRLAGVAPIRSSYEDVATPFEGELCDCHTLGPDGYVDLTLKFETQEMVNAIGEVVDGEVLALTLTGKLLDGTDIQGKDCIIVLSKGGRGRSK